MIEAAIKRHTQNVKFLNSIDRFKGLDSDIKDRLADVLEEVRYEEGDYVIRQGGWSVGLDWWDNLTWYQKRSTNYPLYITFNFLVTNTC